MNLVGTKECKFQQVDQVPYVVFSKWSQDSNLIHCFTTKHGGISEGYLASLNLGFGRGDSEETVCQPTHLFKLPLTQHHRMAEHAWRRTLTANSVKLTDACAG